MTAYRLTPKQEKFCAVYLETGNASEAYRAAYRAENMKDGTVRAAASELLKNPNITMRLTAVSERAQRRTEYNLARALEMAQADWEKARELGQMGAAVSANRLAADLAQLIVAKSESKVTVDGIGSLLSLIDGKSRGLPNDGDTETRH